MLSASEAWALPNCPSNPNLTWSNCVGTHTSANGDIYVGEFKDDQRNGQGTFTSANGNIYVGEWLDDQANGQGTITYANGDIYVGEWKDNKRTGQGTYTFGPESEWFGDNLQLYKNFSDYN
ncbi:MAG: hypothetical protein O3C59_00205 [Proteobacteria bacterium]|nr:hypothetical protein [Pseudomonadota bacterium]